MMMASEIVRENNLTDCMSSRPGGETSSWDFQTTSATALTRKHSAVATADSGWWERFDANRNLNHTDLNMCGRIE